MAKMQSFQRKKAYVACSGGIRSHNCWSGCIGCGACIKACRKGAIDFNEYGVAEVDREACAGCRLCEKACPQHIIHMRREGEPFVALCSNRDKGIVAKKACEVSCIACGLCRKECPAEAVRIEDQCAWIDEDACLSCGNCVITCPRNVIRDLRGIIVS
ncbi:MAG: 4Fe-4S binding protein [Clostridiales bacterium]|nr:4Fe-4S binding protein [Clostridiales bacterium]